jgi:tRNA (guanine-N7-)-methyltransferase
MKDTQNFVGIDIKGARFWRGAKTVETGLHNVALFVPKSN